MSGDPIEIVNLRKQYKEFVAVNDLTFSVKKNSFTGFLGPNGAGKSTTLKILTHLISATSGNAYINGIDITIGENVWIGGSVVVCPGVTIGNNVVIGAGSVVTKDIPDNVSAVGNPCRVLREITEEDRDYYFRDRKFDVDDYK